jgi:ABC-type antimicrobial peptide transport system permease subunit
MTLIGMVSNQLIGFEGRKKECAVLLSTAMGRGALSGILLREMLITSLTASTMGTIVGVLMVFILNNATSASEEMVMAVELDPVMTILFFIFLVAAFTATVLFPIKNLRKMKIAEQIKYE